MRAGTLTALRENSGSRCPKCECVYIKDIDKCAKCGGPLEPAKWYSRFLLERLAFIATAMVLGAAIARFVARADPEARIVAPIIVAMFIPGMYFTVHYFTGGGGSLGQIRR